MRVAYLGNFDPPYSTENIVARALEANGHDVTRIQEGQPAADIVGQACVDLGHHLFVWTQTYGLAVTSGTAEQRYDMLRAIGAYMPTVGYHLDKWWDLPRVDQIEAGEPFFHVDRLCTADGGPHPWHEHGIEHRWFPPGVDEAECRMGDYRPELATDIVFVGGWTSNYHPESTHRHALVRHLRTRWRRHLRLVPRKGAPRVNGQALRDTYASAKLAVGDSCLVPNAPRYWSDRIPETIGRGCMLLHPWVEGLDEHFVDGKHMRMWEAGNWGELDGLIRYYLEHDDERQAIAAEGQRHVIETATYTVRMRQLFDMLRTEGLLPHTAESGARAIEREVFGR